MKERIAGDLGDPLFNAWILHWTSGQVLAALSGDLSALSHYWSANIFFPAPLTLAYSEHLTPQMLQILPFFAATGNIVFCYNLLLFGTIVLSGLGMYLLVRELTGEPLAALLAGLAFAFAPYRIDQWAHLQVLSSQWMPFAFYGLRRFFVTGRLRPLVGGGVAILLQGLSCGYYLAYFTPFAAAYCLYEMAARGRFGDLRAWRALVGVGGAVLVVVAVFLWPYVQVRRANDVGVRDLNDVQQFSADIYGFATISHNSRLWGSRIRAMPRNENQGFPGFAILTFAVVAVGSRLALFVPPARRVIRGARDSTLGFFACAAVGAAWLSLGPVMHLNGHPIGPSLYAIFYRWVPGFDGLRVPSLNFMIVALCLSVLAGLGAAPLVSRGRTGRVLVVLGMIAMLAESWSVPADTNVPLATPGYAPPPSEIADAQGLRPVYRMVRRLPPGAVIAEFPFEDPIYQIQYTFYSAYHRRPIVNGYSGFYPESYRRIAGPLSHNPSSAEAWTALMSSGATHAIVHERAYPGDAGRSVSDWLRRSGARQSVAFGSDVLFELR